MASPLSSAPIPDGSQINAVTQLRIGLTRKYQKFIDDTTPHSAFRWGFTAFAFFLYILRVWYLGGWYIVSYALGIYMLNLLIGFLSPKIDPDVDESIGGAGSILPTKNDDEYRPFIRRLPEFKFWYSVTRAVLIAILCTFFSFLNIPVFWPILLIYFIALFAVTMKNQIKHMIRHRYIPFDFGKKVYKGKKDAK